MDRRYLLQLLSMSGAALYGPRLLFAREEAQAAAPPAFPPQAEIDSDPLRPRYHLMPRRGWMNDPCAPVFFEGRYHLFFQYNPNASVWGDMHWAHVVSPDMVHWSARPVALAPTPGGPDSYGVFTGSMVIDNTAGKPVPKIVYTCVSPSSQSLATISDSHPPEREQQCLAVPASLAAQDADARLDAWTKEGVVIPSPPAGMHVTGFRDPTPWREGDRWYVLLASGEYRKGGDVLLYRSTDLKQWEFVKVFARGQWTGSEEHDTVKTGEMWECPDFFPLGTKHVLIHSTGTPEGRKTVWQVGTLDKGTMSWARETEGVLNHGPYYAPKTQADAQGNRILWGWIPEERPEAAFGKAGWAGCMSLPRVVTLKQGELRFQPAAQVALLRQGAARQAMSLEQEVVITVRKGAPGHGEDPLVRGGLSVARGAGGLRWCNSDVPLKTSLPDEITLRAFVDHSVIEVFVGDALVLTARVYGDGPPASLVLPAGYGFVRAESHALSTVPSRGA